MSTTRTDPLTLWRQIAQAGGVQAYVTAQLRDRGFLVERRDADQMSDREKDQYKKALKQEAAERKQLHGAAQGFLAGRSILSNAAAHTGSKIVLKMDVREFFPTVTWRRVKGVFRRAGYREQIATLLALLCTEAPREVVEFEGKKYYVSLGPRCLPQGAPTSPALTNALCLRLDRRLAGLARKLGWRYTRYADDMTFSLPADHTGPPQLGALLGCVRRVVQAEGFAVNDEKTRVHRTGGRQSV